VHLDVSPSLSLSLLQPLLNYDLSAASLYCVWNINDKMFITFHLKQDWYCMVEFSCNFFQFLVLLLQSKLNAITFKQKITITKFEYLYHSSPPWKLRKSSLTTSHKFLTELIRHLQDFELSSRDPFCNCCFLLACKFLIVLGHLTS
jgi:hypothetical protein